MDVIDRWQSISAEVLRGVGVGVGVGITCLEEDTS